MMSSAFFYSSPRFSLLSWLRLLLAGGAWLALLVLSLLLSLLRLLLAGGSLLWLASMAALASLAALLSLGSLLACGSLMRLLLVGLALYLLLSGLLLPRLSSEPRRPCTGGSYHGDKDDHCSELHHVYEEQVEFRCIEKTTDLHCDAEPYL